MRLVTKIDSNVLEDADGLPFLGLLLGALGLKEKTGFLETDGAFREPGVAGHFGDELALDTIDGLLGFEEAVDEAVVFSLIFGGEHLEAAAESVNGPILRDLFEAGGGARPGAFLGIGAIGRELAF